MTREAEELVVQFLRALDHVLSAAEQAIGPRGLRSLIWEINAGSLPRVGTLSGGIQYYKHGAGVRLETPDGTAVDVDVLPGTTARFDAWRVHHFDRQYDTNRPPLEAVEAIKAIDQALSDLVASGQLRRLPGKFYELIDTTD